MQKTSKLALITFSVLRLLLLPLLLQGRPAGRNLRITDEEMADPDGEDMETDDADA
jgi:hypothetical protein